MTVSLTVSRLHSYSGSIVIGGRLVTVSRQSVDSGCHPPIHSTCARRGRRTSAASSRGGGVMLCYVMLCYAASMRGGGGGRAKERCTERCEPEYGRHEV